MGSTLPTRLTAGWRVKRRGWGRLSAEFTNLSAFFIATARFVGCRGRSSAFQRSVEVGWLLLEGIGWVRGRRACVQGGFAFSVGDWGRRVRGVLVQKDERIVGRPLKINSVAVRSERGGRCLPGEAVGG